MTLRRILSPTAAVCAFVPLLTGCSTFAGNVVLGAVGSTLLGARSPAHEIEQIYYLGVLDPQEQLPEAIYRVTVKGQASFISGTKFASGWVPGAVIDSLSSRVTLDPNKAAGDLAITGGTEMPALKTGRRLVLFGPEGFREAPRDHRLIIVMGSSPQAFFQAVDAALGDFAEIQLERGNADLRQKIFEALLKLKDDQKAVKDLRIDFGEELRTTAGATR
jgi:hypothetical protein